MGPSSQVRIRLMRVRERGRNPFSISQPADVWTFLEKRARGLDRECFWRLDLDARNVILGYEIVSVGTLTASLVHPREVFKGAILGNAAGIIVAHNHPAGDPAPSPEDRQTTRRLADAGKLIGIPLLDHVILGAQSYFSFREKGLL